MMSKLKNNDKYVTAPPQPNVRKMYLKIRNEDKSKKIILQSH